MLKFFKESDKIMSNQNGYIYKITCLINNKVYIGQTIDFKRRKYEHFNRLNRNKSDNKYLQEDYNKYGKENFKFEIIEECKKDNLLERETYWINNYKGIFSKYTYNEKDRNGYNDEYKYNLSKSVSGSKNGMYGKKHKKESIEIMRKKVSIANKGKKRSEECKKLLSEIAKERYRNNSKYSQEFIAQLKNKYKELGSYTAIYKLYPDINNNTLYRLIRFGSTLFKK